MPHNLTAVLALIKVLLRHGRRFAQAITNAAYVAEPRFATLASVCGTYDVTVIGARIQRGILRLLALEAYLLKRGAKGREITVFERRPRAPAAPASEAPAPTDAPAPPPRKYRRVYDPNQTYIPTLEEMQAEVRRNPLGRTMIRICLDLAIVPGFCESEVWQALYTTWRFYGGYFGTFYKVRGEREKTFERERDRRPDTWDWNWQDWSKAKIREALGCLIGEESSLDPPESRTAPA